MGQLDLAAVSIIFDRDASAVWHGCKRVFRKDLSVEQYLKRCRCFCSIRQCPGATGGHIRSTPTKRATLCNLDNEL